MKSFLLTLAATLGLGALLVLTQAPGARGRRFKVEAAPRPTAVRFEVSVTPGLLSAPQDGRMLVTLGRSERPEPRQSIGATGLDASPVLGTDADGFRAGKMVVLDQSCLTFPIEHLSQLEPGEYYAQAVFDFNRDLKSPNAPGNLYSAVQKVRLDPAQGGTVKLVLTKAVPPEQPPQDSEWVKYVKLHSPLLSRFHGRPMYLRAAVVLPRDFDREPDRRYPLRVSIGGYGTRYTSARYLMSSGSSFYRAWTAADAPRMILLFVDGAGPHGDPYQVNSANNGPYGDALTKELIPHVEQKFRGIGQGYARVTEGSSTGGWVSLALQVFYPDFFNGAWSHCPDPVDFRAFELINLYEDDNAYVNRWGFERPSMRERNGDVRFTMRHEVQIERVLGRGNDWTVSGKDWGAWNAVFGPRGANRRPRPFFDGATGKLDPGVRDDWKRYDLRRTLEQNWATLGPALRGKIHIWVGEADDYFLNNAVHLLDNFLTRADPPYGGQITYGPGGGHSWHVISDQQMLKEMAAAMQNRK